MIRGAIGGLAAAALTLGVGELVAAAIDPDSAPFLAVASTTVDRSPAWAREFAIDTFGTNDKTALFVGTGVLIALAAVVAGVFERRRWPWGTAIFVVLGAVGVYAALARPGASAVWALPTIVGVAAGIIVLRLLVRAPRSASAAAETDTPAGPSRRAFFAIAGGAVVVAAAAVAVGRTVASRAQEAVANRGSLRLPTPTSPAPPIPDGVNVDGATTFVTDNAEFYRIDTALSVPRLTTDEWQLRIHGMVDRELTLTWDDLVERDMIERVVTLSCVSNEVGGNLAGNATWIGFPIASLLDEVGVAPDSDMLLSTSSDGFTAGTPVEVLTDGRDAMLAVAMNGEPLPFEHGYPVRQVVPGLYGFVSATKWVVDWELTRFDRAQAYWTQRGWGEQAPIKTASRIESPSASGPVAAGPVTVAGTAWAQHRGIERVEVRVDEGPWQLATLAPQYSIDTWRQWSWVWDAAPGTHMLQVRATDLSGATQPEERVDPIPDGATGWHSRTLRVQ
ncbi:sufite oxidase [Rhodococcus rhodnii LMG 5362]|uniref:Sufite oxidase n=1 Tax=Rhodococcus rhodnii LMG 5362 TaxID=1273125 RepID=R7WI84_9NOCA|nr:sufite oxidase [Rhodococcus rhodnii LMG 5362]